jgi:WD40 repeat protein
MFLMNEKMTRRSIYLLLEGCLISTMCAIGWAQKPELVVQTGHSHRVESVAFSRDGKTLASGSEDNTIKLWDVSSGTELRTLTGHSSSVNSVSFSPLGKTLASGSGDHTIKLWDVSSGTELRTLTGHSSSVNSVSFNPDGKTLASGSGDHTIKLWDITTGTALLTLKGYSPVAFSPNGKTLASGSGDATIKLWDVTSGTELRTLKGHWAYSVAFSSDGKTLASGSQDHTIKLWDVTSGAELRTLRGHFDSVNSVAFSPDGKTLASGSGEAVLRRHHFNSSALAGGFEDFTIKLWDVASGTELRTLKGHFNAVVAVAFSPDGKTLASGSWDKTIKLWKVASGTELRTLTAHSSWVESVSFSPDGKTLASGSADYAINLWDLTSGRELRTLTGPRHSGFELRNVVEFSAFVSVAFSPDGKTLGSGSKDTTIKLWDVTSGRELRTLTGHSQWVRSVAFSPDGKKLASGSEDETIRLWDVTTGRELRTLKGHSDGVFSVAFSPDGKTLASCGGDNTIKLWDVTNGSELRTLKGHSSWVESVAFSPDGTTLASGSEDKSIKLWDVTSGTELRTLEGHSNWKLSVAYSPDAKTLASVSQEKTIKLWDTTSGKEMRTLKGHSDSVYAVAFSSDGKTLASGSADTYLKLWRVADGTELASLVAFDQKDWIAVTPDGLFDGSPAAWNKIIWRFNNNTFDHAPIEAFFTEYYYPGLLTDIFAGKNPKAPSDISQKDRRQPELKVALAKSESSTEVASRTVAVKIDVTELAADKDHKVGSGAQDVRLFRNGSLVKVWHGDVLNGKNSVTLEATVPIVAGANNFTAYAFNHDNIKSSDATLVIIGADSLKRQGTAYILAVGINNYSNPQYNLKYAVADAEDFSAEVKKQQDSLKRYAKVEVTSLVDTAATKANITQALAQLAPKVQPEDAVIIYFAGHGTAQGKQFYLIPHDLGYRGRRDRLSRVGLQKILAHSISDRELEKLFEGIDAGQLLLVIDACNSGQALEAEEKRRGPMNSKGMAQLAYEKGMYVLTAAQSYQAAQEAAKFGHGFLTYALVEDGLKQGAADREPKDRSIDLREWLNYATEQVPLMQKENMLDALRGRSRYLNFVGDGSGPKDTRSNVQRPRIFYRRELDSNPLVIAVLGAATPE